MSSCLRVEDDELQTPVVNLINDAGRRIRVVGVIHVATTSYWRRLNEMLSTLRFGSDGWKVHYELVGNSDELSFRERLIRWTLRTPMKRLITKMERMELVYQMRGFHPPYDSLNTDLTIKQIIDEYRGSIFVSILRTLGMIVLVKILPPRLIRQVFVQLAEGKSPTTSGLNGISDEVLVNRRNHIAVDACMAEDSNVVMVWGAFHVEGIVSLLSSRGFRVVDTTWQSAFSVA